MRILQKVKALQNLSDLEKIKGDPYYKFSKFESFGKARGTLIMNFQNSIVWKKARGTPVHILFDSVKNSIFT